MASASSGLKLGVLGAGNIGRPIGRHWLAAGHTVTFGSREPGALQPFVAQLGHHAAAASHLEAVEASEVILLSVPHPALDELLAAIGARLAGRIVIDATNPMGLSSDGRIISTLDPGRAQGSRTAAMLPSSQVVRAFTHVMDELLWSRGTQQAHFWGMAIAGDDAAAKEVVAGLVRDTGFTPVDIGGLDDSARLDPGGVIFPHMFTPADLRAAAGLTA